MKDLLLLHGAIGAKDQLATLAEKLRPAFTIHTIDFSGHGGMAFADEEFSIPLFADEVLSYIHSNQVSRLDIFGYSMGGYVALYLARHQPTLVDKVITLATKFHWDQATAAKEIKMLDADTISEKVPAFAEQLRKRHHPNDWKLVLAQTKVMLEQLGRENALHPEDFKAIAAPCLLLLGDKDKMVTVEETIAVQEALPHGLFRALANTPHPIEQVDNDLLAAMISDFLEEKDQ